MRFAGLRVLAQVGLISDSMAQRGIIGLLQQCSLLSGIVPEWAAEKAEADSLRE